MDIFESVTDFNEIVLLNDELNDLVLEKSSLLNLLFEDLVNFLKDYSFENILNTLEYIEKACYGNELFLFHSKFVKLTYQCLFYTSLDAIIVQRMVKLSKGILKAFPGFLDIRINVRSVYESLKQLRSVESIHRGIDLKALTYRFIELLNPYYYDPVNNDTGYTYLIEEIFKIYDPVDNTFQEECEFIAKMINFSNILNLEHEPSTYWSASKANFGKSYILRINDALKNYTVVELPAIVVKLIRSILIHPDMSAVDTTIPCLLTNLFAFFPNLYHPELTQLCVLTMFFDDDQSCLKINKNLGYAFIQSLYSNFVDDVETFDFLGIHHYIEKRDTLRESIERMVQQFSFLASKAHPATAAFGQFVKSISEALVKRYYVQTVPYEFEGLLNPNKMLTTDDFQWLAKGILDICKQGITYSESLTFFGSIKILQVIPCVEPLIKDLFEGIIHSCNNFPTPFKKMLTVPLFTAIIPTLLKIEAFDEIVTQINNVMEMSRHFSNAALQKQVQYFFISFFSKFIINDDVSEYEDMSENEEQLHCYLSEVFIPQFEDYLIDYATFLLDLRSSHHKMFSKLVIHFILSVSVKRGKIFSKRLLTAIMTDSRTINWEIMNAIVRTVLWISPELVDVILNQCMKFLSESTSDATLMYISSLAELCCFSISTAFTEKNINKLFFILNNIFEHKKPVISRYSCMGFEILLPHLLIPQLNFPYFKNSVRTHLNTPLNLDLGSYEITWTKIGDFQHRLALTIISKYLESVIFLLNPKEYLIDNEVNSKMIGGEFWLNFVESFDPIEIEWGSFVYLNGLKDLQRLNIKDLSDLPIDIVVRNLFRFFMLYPTLMFIPNKFDDVKSTIPSELKMLEMMENFNTIFSTNSHLKNIGFFKFYYSMMQLIIDQLKIYDLFASSQISNVFTSFVFGNWAGIEDWFCSVAQNFYSPTIKALSVHSETLPFNITNWSVSCVVNFAMNSFSSLYTLICSVNNINRFQKVEFDLLFDFFGYVDPTSVAGTIFIPPLDNVHFERNFFQRSLKLMYPTESELVDEHYNKQLISFINRRETKRRYNVYGFMFEEILEFHKIHKIVDVIPLLWEGESSEKKYIEKISTQTVSLYSFTKSNNFGNITDKKLNDGTKVLIGDDYLDCKMLESITLAQSKESLRRDAIILELIPEIKHNFNGLLGYRKLFIAQLMFMEVLLPIPVIIGNFTSNNPDYVFEFFKLVLEFISTERVFENSVLFISLLLMEIMMNYWPNYELMEYENLKPFISPNDWVNEFDFFGKIDNARTYHSLPYSALNLFRTLDTKFPRIFNGEFEVFEKAHLSKFGHVIIDILSNSDGMKTFFLNFANRTNGIKFVSGVFSHLIRLGQLPFLDLVNDSMEFFDNEDIVIETRAMAFATMFHGFVSGIPYMHFSTYKRFFEIFTPLLKKYLVITEFHNELVQSFSRINLMDVLPTDPRHFKPFIDLYLSLVKETKNQLYVQLYTTYFSFYFCSFIRSYSTYFFESFGYDLLNNILAHGNAFTRGYIISVSTLAISSSDFYVTKVVDLFDLDLKDCQIPPSLLKLYEEMAIKGISIFGKNDDEIDSNTISYFTGIFSSCEHAIQCSFNTNVSILFQLALILQNHSCVPIAANASDFLQRGLDLNANEPYLTGLISKIVIDMFNVIDKGELIFREKKFLLKKSLHYSIELKFLEFCMTNIDPNTLFPEGTLYVNMFNKFLLSQHIDIRESALKLIEKMYYRLTPSELIKETNYDFDVIEAYLNDSDKVEFNAVRGAFLSIGSCITANIVSLFTSDQIFEILYRFVNVTSNLATKISNDIQRKHFKQLKSIVIDTFEQLRHNLSDDWTELLSQMDLEKRHAVEEFIPSPSYII
eukprot:TRINITY_DN428_c0_g1_i1.p1 TRINITY_DN428_c0_g1~~TRINITY_DN428_c0_g1_i1.p1  ORF type:complete len:1874 (-),score=462.56 TRINITY_DN428_c0_g1_i1:236-5806(-)